MPHTTDKTSDVPTSVLQYLMGKTLNVMPEHDSKAQDHLSNAIKLNPSFVDAWNELGKFCNYRYFTLSELDSLFLNRRMLLENW